MSIATQPAAPTAAAHVEETTSHLNVAYIVSRFPKLTETFVLYEILALQERGISVSVFPLLGAQNASTRQGASLLGKLLELLRRPGETAVMHREAEALVRLASYHPFLSWKILRAQWHFLVRKPRAYCSALWSLVRGNWGSPRFLLAGLAIFPKTVLFAREIERQQINHIHAHFANHPAAAAFIVHRLTGVGYSFTAHGSDLHVDRHMLADKVREAEQVVTISQYNRDLILRECGGQYADKVHVVHCGVDADIFAPSETAGDGVTGEDRAACKEFHVLCIGTMHEVKGQTYLLEASRRLRDSGCRVVCHLIGSGPDEAALKQQAADAGLRGHVIFHGLKTRDQVATLLRRADVLAAPSVPAADGRREGIPVVLMEAMASGVPVVSSELSGIPELVENEVSGLLVAPRDAAGLAAALKRLLDDPQLRRRLAAGGRDKVLREFNLRRNAATLVDLFDEAQS